jgi:hypothetical protein
MVADGVTFLFLVEFVTCKLLSAYIKEGPVNGIPIMQNLYQSPHSFIATNSAPKTEVSMVACFLETKSIRAILQKMRKPVQEHLVLLSPTWSLSHIMRMSTSLPEGSGMSTGIVSSTSP